MCRLRTDMCRAGFGLIERTMSQQILDEKSIFNIARRIDGRDARSEFLDQVCGTDPEMIKLGLQHQGANGQPAGISGCQLLSGFALL